MGAASVTERDAAKQLLTAARAPSTWHNNDGRYEAFARWCATVGETPYPVSERALARYTTHLHVKGTVGGPSLHVYLAPMHNLAGRAGDRFKPSQDLQLYYDGFRRLHAPPPGTRGSFVRIRFFDRCARELAREASHTRRERLAALLTQFLLGLRALSLAFMRGDHWHWQRDGADVTVAHEKTKGVKRARVVSIPRYYLRAVEHFVRGRGPSALFPQLGDAAHDRLTSWLRQFGEEWNMPETRLQASHDVRRAMATYAHRIGVTQPNLLRHGNWASVQSLVTYVDAAATVPDEDAERAGHYLGFLLVGAAPRDAPAATVPPPPPPPPPAAPTPAAVEAPARPDTPPAADDAPAGRDTPPPAEAPPAVRSPKYEYKGAKKSHTRLADGAPRKRNYPATRAKATQREVDGVAVPRNYPATRAAPTRREGKPQEPGTVP